MFLSMQLNSRIGYFQEYRLHVDQIKKVLKSKIWDEYAIFEFENVSTPLMGIFFEH